MTSTQTLAFSIIFYIHAAFCVKATYTIDKDSFKCQCQCLFICFTASVHHATKRQVAGSTPDGAIGIFQWHNPSGRTKALESTQPLTEMSTRCISWGQRRPVRKADNLTTILCRCHEIRNLNFLEPSGPIQDCFTFYLSLLQFLHCYHSLYLAWWSKSKLVSPCHFLMLHKNRGNVFRRRRDLFTARMLHIFPFKGVLFLGTKTWSIKSATLISYVSMRDLLFFF
jgi:hypothetical protein